MPPQAAFIARRLARALDLCKEKDAELSKLLNERSRDIVASGDAFRSWHEGDDSNAVRNV